MRSTRSVEERFWEKVQKSADGCWLWTGTQNGRGYGSLHSGQRANRKTLKAHRYSYELHTGETVPSSMEVMHSCDNRLCVNPAHLSVGTKADNMRDMAAKGRVCTIGKSRVTHCHKGHEFTPENTDITTQGHRRCRTCRLEQQRAAYLARHPDIVQRDAIAQAIRSSHE